MEQKLLDIRQTAKALGMRNHRKLQNVCNRLPGFPVAIKLEDGPFKPVFYAEREIVAYSKTHNITDELRKVYTQIRKEGKARRSAQKKAGLAAPDSIEFQFLRGDFAPAEVRATFKTASKNAWSHVDSFPERNDYEPPSAKTAWPHNRSGYTLMLGDDA